MCSTTVAQYHNDTLLILLTSSDRAKDGDAHAPAHTPQKAMFSKESGAPRGQPRSRWDRGPQGTKDGFRASGRRLYADS